jgi:hypothetical protein
MKGILIIFLLIVPTTLAVEDPLDECSCGLWKSQYKKMHDDIISGASSPRYAVFITPSSGFAGVRFCLVATYMMPSLL